MKTQSDADQDRSPEARFSFRALRRWLSLSPEEGTAASVRAPRTFRALRHRNFRLFWWGQLVSLSGTWMQITARIVGPAIAGALVRAMGEAGAFTVNAVSFTAVLISLVRMNTAELLPWPPRA